MQQAIVVLFQRTHLHVPAPLVPIGVPAMLPAELLADSAEDSAGVVVHGHIRPLVGVRPLFPPFLHHLLLLLGMRRQPKCPLMFIPLRRRGLWLAVHRGRLRARDEEALVVVGGDDGVLRGVDAHECGVGEGWIFTLVDLEVDLLTDAADRHVVLVRSLRLPQQVHLVHGPDHAYARGDMRGSGRGLDSPLLPANSALWGFGSRVGAIWAPQSRRRRPASAEVKKCADLPHGERE